MVLGNNDLTIQLDDGDRIFATEDSVSGNAQVEVKKPFKIEEIQARLICAIEVRIEEKDQRDNNIRHNIKHKTKILDQEQRILTTPQYFEPGTYDFPFNFVLPQLPPTYSYKANKETYGTIKHYIKVHVKKSSKYLLKMFNLDARRYFTYVPLDNIPPNILVKEQSFTAEITSRGGDKVLQSIDPSGAGIDAFKRYTKTSGGSPGLVALNNILKTQLGRKSNKLLLGFSVRVPSGLKQDETTGVSLKVTTANDMETIMLRTISIKLHKFQVLKVEQFVHERVIETVPLFHKVLLRDGVNFAVPGSLEFEKSTLPSFSTEHFSHFHKLEVNIEVSHIKDGEILPCSEVIELLPIHVYSFIDGTHSLPKDARERGLSRFIADSRTGVPLAGYQTDVVDPNYGETDRDSSPASSQVGPHDEPYMPDIDYRSRNNSAAIDVQNDEKKGAHYVPSGYPVDTKEEPPSYEVSK